MVRFALIWLLAFTAAAAAGPRATTGDGALEGISTQGISEYLGIAYAAPPVGDLRWRAPAAPAKWSGVRQATKFGPTCAQVTTLGPFAGPANSNEDCLYLNVFAPPAKEKLPVLVWIHGGGYFDGESNDYDAARLARQGKLIVVTLNYRLNLFGFLDIPALGKPGGNYGLMDMVAALKWVRANIAAFGGDPANITLGGQSAGAGAASALAVAPSARGLFQRAIFMSGGYTPLVPKDVALKKGRQFAAAAGCDQTADQTADQTTDKAADVAQCLRALPAGKIAALSGTASGTAPFVSGAMVDGDLVPQSAAEAYGAGAFNRVPVMVGTTRDEGNFAIGIAQYFREGRTPATLEDFHVYAKRMYGGNAGPGGTPPPYPPGTPDKMLALYAPEAHGGVQMAWADAHADMLACRGQYLAGQIAPFAPVYAYVFDDRSAPSYFPQMKGFTPGAYHTADLIYLFPGYHGGPDGVPTSLNAGQRKLSDRMIAAWANFARSGNPNGKGDAPWPRWRKNADAPSHFIQNDAWAQVQSTSQFSAAHNCGFWDQVLRY
ncbi:MAG: carboxylesterase family protein [Alphaproteobacteria bacterium]|nr:carboxylesterase family protein [Alphaproteobacteria bacterium]